MAGFPALEKDDAHVNPFDSTCDIYSPGVPNIWRHATVGEIPVAGTKWTFDDEKFSIPRA